MTRLSVVVPASNAPPTLDRHLESVERSVGTNDELLVVTEPNGAPVPPAFGTWGARRAKGDALMFVDADVAAHEDSLEHIRVLNEEFYGALPRRRGPRTAAAGVVLHALQHLVGVAGVPFRMLRYLRELKTNGA